MGKTMTSVLSELNRRSAKDLQACDAFDRRHIGPDPGEQAAMLETLGVTSLHAFVEQVLPESIHRRNPMALESGVTEKAALDRLQAIAKQNRVLTSFIGMGYANTHVPAVIQRNLLENPAWYTAYTPYQPEISQGRLEALLNFQTMVSDLTGLELANASMLDEATACAEAMTLCRRVNKSSRANAFFVSEDCHPQTIEVVKTRAKPLGIEVQVGDPEEDLTASEHFAVLLQYPGTDGRVCDYTQLIEAIHQQGALVVMATDLLSLTLLKPPGEMGADVAVGNSQRFGVPLGYGGPHAAFMATHDQYKRAMPGRLVGVSVDADGKPAYRLALQTREQHIRREKATSNICTAQALLAVMAGMYAVWHGPQGLTQMAARIHRYAVTFAKGVTHLGYEVRHDRFFDTVAVRVNGRSENVLNRAEEAGYNLRNLNEEYLCVALDETATLQDVQTLWQVFAEASEQPVGDLSAYEMASVFETPLPENLHRETEFLTHPVFHNYRSETEMMRYLRRLADKDLALDRAMIPLGSCTMKLNAAAELMPVGWPEFANIHPFAPTDQTQGYRQLCDELEMMLCAVTGYDAVSLQPNSGAQGEYAGLLAIRAYLRQQGEAQRNVCLIPASAHGTNPASAQMAGMEVVVVATAANGEIDLDDLDKQLQHYSDRVAAIMLTYPSTHGVFEANVKTVCKRVHDSGAQVYIDGANLNALVGLAAPGEFGGDVSHLNLHKTFAIPHGGGGPGVGPIVVKSHLAPFLPQNNVASQEDQVGPVSAAPYGSAGILPVSWMYLQMMGAEGLEEATSVAILNANYIAKRLSESYPVLYQDDQGWVAHECIIDLRPITQATGVTAEDVAKRLIDYGFHAPTMSFPVAGTFMIEPTESESKAELDRFCDAMLSIRSEIREIELGRMEAGQSPLRQAPHPAHLFCEETWPYRYSRQIAAYPLEELKEHKYWVPVRRIDNVYGDRNLVCTCPPLSAYQAKEKA